MENISVVVIGYDFEFTTGTVIADFLPSKGHYTQSYQYHQWIGSNQHCSNITYIIYSNNTHETLYLHTSENTIPYYYSDKEYLNESIGTYNSNRYRCVEMQLLTTPVFMNITLLDGCPPGFTLTFKG